jgi:predicted RNase H-like nuclease (RuvC/YqgF family)
MSQAEIAKKIEELKRSRSELRDKLNNFQNEFSNLHHRKIRFHRDIAPVEKEYKMYKDIKQEIQKLESMLKK